MLQAVNAASVTKKAPVSRFGWLRLCPSAMRTIAGKRIQATMRSACAIASPEPRKVDLGTGYSIRPRRIAIATAAALSDTPNFE